LRESGVDIREKSSNLSILAVEFHFLNVSRIEHIDFYR